MTTPSGDPPGAGPVMRPGTRLVICADGTWNHRDQRVTEDGKRRPSNVTKLARAVRSQDDAGVPQVVYYHEGVGTAGGLDRWTGGAFGAGIEANVRELYRFIVYNHVPGDELYFFGFSRGAFTVRTLAGFLRKVGVIEQDEDYYVPDLYACYERGRHDGHPAWEKLRGRVQLRECPPIRFLGVWDTVGALGAPGFLGQLLNPRKYAYHDVALHPAIEHAVQALAIDEHRKPFLPTLWQRPPGWGGTLVQAWFPGAHTDVGGGGEPDGLANEALHWIVGQAEDRGLAFNREYLRHFRPCFNAVLHDSMTPLYRLLGRVQRAVGADPDAGEALHQAVLDRRAHPACAYKPPALTAPARGTRPGALPTVTTPRVPRGSPCPERGGHR